MGKNGLVSNLKSDAGQFLRKKRVSPRTLEKQGELAEGKKAGNLAGSPEERYNILNWAILASTGE